MTYWRRGAIAVALLATLPVAACGSSGQGDATVRSAASHAPTKSPIKVAAFADVTAKQGSPTFGIAPQAAKIAADAINAKGGIDGHPLEVEVCDLQGIPEQAARCARQAVQDHVAAVIASFVIFGGQRVTPILEAAGIPYIPAYAFNPSELTSSISFPVAVGFLTQVGAGVLAAEYCAKPALVTLATGTADYVYQQARIGMDNAGQIGIQARAPGAVIKKVVAPIGATDWAPIAAQAVGDGTDCILPYTSEVNDLAFYPALKQAGYGGKVVGYAGGAYTEKLLEQFPDVLDDAETADISYPLSDPRWNGYRAAIKQFNDDDSYTNWGSTPAKGGYLSALVFAEVARRVAKDGQPVTSSTMLKAFNSATDVETGGLLPPLDFSHPWSVKQYSRLFLRSVMFETIKDGKVTATDGGQFQDLSKVIKAGIPG